ncbi:hypothetical protein OS493_012740 [Desmophyllum pertusum]|uniref:Chitin-binding type-4 domain-containing protein n=1 Tax=Desmophyllum pertusum TaxID=174260 RepID=A0A9X0CZC5_9CNID|nr:hypothetical protein OS493_012740 [Desmophyllum pertusum]
MTAIFGVFVALSMIVLVVGHGHIRDPPSRNAAWTCGFDTPKQYTYNELNCGGFSRQWDKNGGKCGVCGDPYDKSHPQYVHPGKYATKTITKTYREGQEIEVKIKVTTNHMGSFTFSVGEIGTAPITQEKLKYVLKQPNGATKWKINVAKKDAEFKIKLVLPRGLTCDHCVMQWWWKVGNSWGCDGPNDCGMGKGRQETFVNCADIRITKSDGSVPRHPQHDLRLLHSSHRSPQHRNLPSLRPQTHLTGWLQSHRRLERERNHGCLVQR